RPRAIADRPGLSVAAGCRFLDGATPGSLDPFDEVGEGDVEGIGEIDGRHQRRVDRSPLDQRDVVAVDGGLLAERLLTEPLLDPDSADVRAKSLGPLPATARLRRVPRPRAASTSLPPG